MRRDCENTTQHKWFPLQAIIDDATLDASVRRMARMVVD
jgi:hypothetical protein